MLHIYPNCKREEIISNNDREFETNTIKKMKANQKYKDIISKVEGIKFITDDMLISRIDNSPISIPDISTGCKTLLNIIYNPDKIVSTVECGNNYSKYIYNLKDGKVYMPFFMIPDNREEIGKTNIVIHTDSGTVKIENLNDLERWYSENNE